ncbi:MAG: EthD domain-containing protein [Halieaceae bacterium]|jgi:hypothetical protein|nr:EthD domain-containing protein [Halieaceae bacterium]
MEKIIYLVRTSTDTNCDNFRQQALGEISQRLLQNDKVQKLTMSFDDSDVARAADLRQEYRPPLPQATISVWVSTANTHSELVDILKPYTSRIEGYLVTESEVMAPPIEEGQRTEGVVQVCGFTKLEALSEEAFLTVWKESHGPLACDIQSTFGYRQNLVARKLTPEAADYSAIVEEYFPADSMDSPHVFYDTEGDDEKLQQNVNTMIESCVRFIDFETINVVHMSEYTVKV